MSGYYVVKQQTEPGHVRLVECDEYGCVTVHRTRDGAAEIVQEKGGEVNGYFVARDRVRRDQAIVNIVD